MRIISFCQHKGGTGKTSTTLNLGAGLAAAGRKVLLVDMDPQYNLTASLDTRDCQPAINELNMFHYMTTGIRKPKPLKINENLYLLPSSLDLLNAETMINAMPARDRILKKLLSFLNADFYDFVLIDSPPSLGVLTLNVLMASDEIYIPMVAEPYALQGLTTLKDTLDKISYYNDLEVGISGILFTRIEPMVIHRDCMEEVKQVYGELVLPFYIRKNVSITECTLRMQSVFEYAPKSNAATDYGNLVDWFNMKNI